MTPVVLPLQRPLHWLWSCSVTASPCAILAAGFRHRGASLGWIPERPISTTCWSWEMGDDGNIASLWVVQKWGRYLFDQKVWTKSTAGAKTTSSSKLFWQCKMSLHRQWQFNAGDIANEHPKEFKTTKKLLTVLLAPPDEHVFEKQKPTHTSMQASPEIQTQYCLVS